jgi:hypothetical protein
VAKDLREKKRARWRRNAGLGRGENRKSREDRRYPNPARGDRPVWLERDEIRSGLEPAGVVRLNGNSVRLGFLRSHSTDVTAHVAAHLRS